MRVEDVVVVGAGISGLAFARFLKSGGFSGSLLLVEQSARAGGIVRSCHDSGFQAEWGPHGFLDNNPASLELLKLSGLSEQIVKAPLKKNVRYVCRQGKLEPLAQSAASLWKTPLLSFKGKLRIAGELFQPPLPDGLSVGQWAAARFGDEVLPLVDAAVTGTYAGDLDRLKIDAVMPGARRLERSHGSLFKGLLKEWWQRKRSASGKAKKEKRAFPSMISFPAGMGYLPERLAEGIDISFKQKVEQISRTESGHWRISGEGFVLLSRELVLALPINISLSLMKEFRPPLPAVPEAQLVNVLLGFRHQDADVPLGFGYLAPEREKRFSLGTLFSSQMFPERAPQQHHLLEVLVGGRRHPERMELSDEQLVEKVCADLKELIRIKGAPVFTRVLRSENEGIPQLESGHQELLAWRNNLQKEQPGLQLIGFGWDGIGINDMIKSARECAEAIKGRPGQEEEAQPRQVYF